MLQNSNSEKMRVGQFSGKIRGIGESACVQSWRESHDAKK